MERINLDLAPQPVQSGTPSRSNDSMAVRECASSCGHAWVRGFKRVRVLGCDRGCGATKRMYSGQGVYQMDQYKCKECKKEPQHSILKMKKA